jgi:hypothetical protein
MTNTSNISKVKYFQLFNNKMNEFIRDLINVFPDDKDFKLFKNSFDLLKIANEEQPCKVFYNVTQKFKQHILEKNEIFFLEKDYTDIIETDTDITTSLINKLKNYWTLLENDKQTVWNYLIVLVKLSDKCCS